MIWPSASHNKNYPQENKMIRYLLPKLLLIKMDRLFQLFQLYRLVLLLVLVIFARNVVLFDLHL